MIGVMGMRNSVHIILDLAECTISLEGSREDYTIKLTVKLGKQKCEELSRMKWQDVELVLDFIKRLIHLLPISKPNIEVMGP